MHPDGVLVHEEYNLRSTHHLGGRDLAYVPSWTDPRHVLFRVFTRLHKQRLARRKEFFETLFVLDRLAPELSRARTLIELGAGHGMVGLLAALLHPNLRRIEQVDRTPPPSWGGILERLAPEHPHLKVRTRYHERRLDGVRRLPGAGLVVGVHCCGALTDHVARLAREAGAPFAVVPCCEPRALLPPSVDEAAVAGDDIPRLVNDARLARWRRWGYRVEERRLPERVTDRPRLFVASPPVR